ncbi:MAG: iron ABC transporter permease, partial [Actinobacteria bacterium]|nr:iron ABC transporter permease [Actinomycetota bacterium]
THDYGWGSAIDVATSSRSLSLLWSTLILAVAVTITTVAIALPVAWLTVRTDLPGRRIWAVLTVLPLAIPTYVGSWAIIGALGPRGMLANILSVDSIPSLYGFWGAWAALSLFSYPYVLLTVRAAWSRLDPGLEEASRMLGRSPRATFVHIVWPQLRPAVVGGSLLVALYTLSDFGAVAMMRYDTFTRAIYVQYRGALDRGAAAVLGLMLVILTIVVLSGEQRLRRRESLHRLHGSGARAPRRVELGRARWVALAGLGTLVTLSLAVPLGVIGYWLVRGLRANEPVWPGWNLMTNSLSVSLAAAAITTVAAIPVAVFARRSPGRLARIVERLSWSGYALPGIVVALALVYFGARVVPWAYQTTAMLVFAYAVLFLPQAVGAIRASLLQVTPSVEEASLLLGADRRTTFRRVLLPLLRPGLGAGAGLVFLTTMKELPATLLLSPTGFSTLATRVWNATSEGFLGRSAGPALALVLLSSVPMAVLLARNELRASRPVAPDEDHSAAKAGDADPSQLSLTR